MMIQEVNAKVTVGGVLVYVLAYAGWLLTTLLGLVTVFYTRHVLDMAWRAIGLHMGLDPVVVTIRVRFYDRLGTLILLLLWAAFAFFTEYHYRSSVDAARRRQSREEAPQARQAEVDQRPLREWGIDILTRRFLISTSIPLVLLAVAYLIGQITLWSI